MKNHPQRGIIITPASSGGDYLSEPHHSLEMGDRYMRVLFNFLGICDFTTISADKLDIVGEDAEAIMSRTIEKAQEAAKVF
ncbi:MAG: hypothetical protein GX556_17180 [Fibrobacter sp.]|nr:hypothetical protein [Fibrobacter sp.]